MATGTQPPQERAAARPQPCTATGAVGGEGGAARCEKRRPPELGRGVVAAQPQALSRARLGSAASRRASPACRSREHVGVEALEILRAQWARLR